jgi:hypothetical protein
MQMQDPEEMTLEQVKAVAESNRAIRFSIEGREAVYGLLVRVLKNQHWRTAPGAARDREAVPSKSERLELSTDHAADP